MRFITPCLTIVAMVGLLLSASCSAATPSQGTLGTSPSVAKPYGSLTIATVFGVGILDPQGDTGTTYQNVTHFIIDSLVTLGADGKLIPSLAERWQISPDGMRHTFYIRKGVKFHDGSDLTGADVKFSLERMMAPESPNSSAKSRRTSIDNIDLEDEHTVVLRLRAPAFELLSNMEVDASPIMPKKYIEEKGADYFGKHIIGSGPFKLVSYEPGTRLELEAVESHWRAVPQFKNITLVNVPEEGARVTMLKTGELDIAEVSVDSIAAVEAAGLRTMSWDAGAMVAGWFYYDTDDPGKYAVGDQRVRKALVLGMNRMEIADKLVGGKGSPSIMFPVSPSEEFFDPNVLKLDPYDPEQAKRLLAQAGYPDGFDMRIWNVVGGLPLLNQAVAGYWLRIGVKAQLEPIDFGAFTPLRKTPKVWNSIWIWPSRTQRGFVSIALRFHSQWSVTTAHNLNDPRLNELIEKASVTTNTDERKRLMTQAAATAKDTYSTIGIVNLYQNLAFGPKVGQATPYWGRQMGSMIETMTHAK